MATRKTVIPVKLRVGLLTELTTGKLKGKNVGPYNMKAASASSRRNALQVAVNKLKRQGYHCRKCYNKLIYMLNIQAVFRKKKTSEQATYKRLEADIAWLQSERERVCPYQKGYTLGRKAITRRSVKRKSVKRKGPKIGDTKTVNRAGKRVRMTYSRYKGRDGKMRTGWHVKK